MQPWETDYTIEYFLIRLAALDEATWGLQSFMTGGKQVSRNKALEAENAGKLKLSELLADDEYLALICICGTHLRAINDGELDYFMIGTTPKARVLAWLTAQQARLPIASVSTDAVS